MGLLLLWNGSVQGTAGTFPTVYLEWSPTTNPGGVPVWERIPLADIRSIDINRGRNRELDQFQAGRMSVVLDNRDRHYDPQFTTGPNFGNVKPMKRIRLRAVWDTTYDLFSGFVDSWDQDYEMTDEAICTVTATDGFKVLARWLFENSVYSLETLDDTPTLYFRLGDRAGSTTVIDSINGFALTEFGTGATLGAAGLNEFDSNTALSLTGTTSGFFESRSIFTVGDTVTDQITIEAIVQTTVTTDSTFVSISDGGEGIRMRLLVDSTGVAQFEYGETKDGNTQSAGVNSTTLVNDGEPHHVVAVLDRSTFPDMFIYVDGVLENTATGALTAAAGASQEVCIGNVGDGYILPVRHAQGLVGTVDEVAIYQKRLSTTRIAAHADALLAPWNGDTTGERIVRLLDLFGWPTAERDVDDGESTLQSAELTGSVLAHAQLVRDTEFGELLIAPNGDVRFISRHNKWLPPYNDPLFTLSDDGSDLGYGKLKFNYDDQLIRNRVTVGYDNGLTFTANSTESQDDFLIQSFSQTGLIGDVDSEAVDYANYVLNRYDEPLLRVQGITITPQRNPATHFPNVLAADLVFQVNVERTPQSVGSAIDIDYTIEGVSHHIEPKFWRTDLQLSPADTPGAFILDSTSQGILDTNALGF